MIKKSITLFIVVSLFIPFCVNAALWQEPSASGVGAPMNSPCGASSYCWNSPGARVTLYKQEASTAVMVGRSHDFWRSDGVGTGDPDPRDNYKPRFVPLTFDDINNKKSGTKIKENKFTVSASTYRNYDDTEVSYLNSYQWQYSFFSQSSQFLDWMNNINYNYVFTNYFSTFELAKKNLELTDSDVSDMIANKEKYFLVVELMASIYAGQNVSLPDGFSSKNVNYVGTAYQLSSFYTKHDVVFRLAKALYLQNQDVSTFVKRNGTGVLIPVLSADSSVNESYIRSSKTVGMTIYRLNDIIQVRTCQDVCGGSPSLTCASNYCETAEGVNSSIQKRTCMINQCNYKKKYTLSCNSSCPSTKTTECDNDSRVNSPSTNLNTINSCKLYEEGEKNYLNGKEYYYKVSCTEKNKVFYPDTLPTTIGTGIGGFDYYLDILGEKQCTFKFNKDKYNFEKAALYGSEKTSDTSIPEKALTKFKGLTVSTVDSFVKYNNDFDVTLKIGSTEETLVTDETRTNSIVNSLSGANGMNDRTSKSTGTTRMLLQPKCYNIKNGSVYMPPLGQDCSYGGNLLYNSNTFGYFSTETNEYKVETKLNINKENAGTSCNLAEDKCYFYKEKITTNNNADCVLSITDFDGNEAEIDDGYYKENIRVTYNHLLYDIDESDVIGYCLEEICNNNPNKFRNYYVPASGVVEEYVSASIKYKDKDGNTVVKSCPVNVKLKKNPTTTTNETCTELYEPTQYEAINNYCATEYNNDRKKYANSEECINDCSSSRVICKLRYTPNELDKIVNYCNNYYGVDGSGYDSAEQCINDCSNPIPDTNEYIYRPIAVGLKDGGSTRPGSISFSAFPDRIAGSNWIGYENRYTTRNPYYSDLNPTDASNTKDAIYIIELDSDSIKEIRSDTRSKGKGVYFYNEPHDVVSGKYVSNLIEDMPNVFICRNGSGNCSTTEGSGW